MDYDSRTVELDWDTVWDKVYYNFFKPDFYYNSVVCASLMTFETEWTINYPNEKSPMSPIFRGEHALRRYIYFDYLNFDCDYY